MTFVARLPVQIRFCDVDSLGHVNNAFYLSYFELARMEYFRLSGLKINWNKTGFILARVEIDYIKPVLLHDLVEVSCRAGTIGNKSFELWYEVISVNQAGIPELHCKGRTVQVCFDYERKHSIPVPEDWKPILSSKNHS
jgi:acyl-CoA thioester hydrolase